MMTVMSLWRFWIQQKHGEFITWKLWNFYFWDFASMDFLNFSKKIPQVGSSLCQHRPFHQGRWELGDVVFWVPFGLFPVGSQAMTHAKQGIELFNATKDTSKLQVASCLTVLQRWELLERTNLKQRNCSCGDILNTEQRAVPRLHTLLDVTSGFADSSYAWHYHRHLLNEDRKGFG